MGRTVFEASGGSKLGDWLLNNKLKRSLQFSGWLQYLSPLPLSFGAFGAGRLIHMVVGLVGSNNLSDNDSNHSVDSIVKGLNWSAAALVVNFFWEIVTTKYQLLSRFDLPVDADREKFRNKTMIDVILDRHSNRVWHTQSLNSEDRSFVIDFAQKACQPSNTLGSAPIRFIYVKKRLTVWPGVNAKEFFIAIAPKKYSREATRDVGRGIENVVLQAHRRGIATCLIGPGTDQDSAQAALKESDPAFDPTKDHIILSCAVGYRSQYVPLFMRSMGFESRSRNPIQSFFFLDSPMTRPIDDSLPNALFSRLEKCMEACRWAPSSYNAQPVRAVMVVGNKDSISDTEPTETTLKRVDFYTYGPSRYYGVVALGIWMRHWETACDVVGIAGRFVEFSEAQQKECGIWGCAPDTTKYGASYIVEACDVGDGTKEKVN